MLLGIFHITGPIQCGVLIGKTTFRLLIQPVNSALHFRGRGVQVTEVAELHADSICLPMLVVYCPLCAIWLPPFCYFYQTCCRKVPRAAFRLLTSFSIFLWLHRCLCLLCHGGDSAY